MAGFQTNLLQALGIALLNSLWQLALLWVLYQVITALLNKGKSSLKSILAVTLLIAGFGSFIAIFISALSVPDHSIAVSLILIPENFSTESNDNLLQNLYPVIAFVYLVLLSIPFHRFIKNYRYVQALRTYGLNKIDIDKRLFVDRVAARLGITKKVKLWISEFVTSPATIGYLKPIILIPAAAITNLTPQQLESVILHELAHIRRNDYLINLLINFIKAILYFNPFAKAFVRIIEKERERSCDELVLQFQYDSKEYATALLTLEKEQQQRALAIAASGRTTDLINRVESILGISRQPTFSIYKLAGVAAGLLVILFINALVFPGNNQKNGFKLLAFEQRLAEPAKTYINYQNPLAEGYTQIKTPSVSNKQIPPAPALINAPVPVAANPPADFINVAFDEADIPELKKYQEEQVKKAIEATKRLLEKAEWEKVENSIAEALSMKEKEELKLSYLKELEKLDWKQWENRLKVAYNSIDWDNVNNQLNTAINQIKTDSLHRVYNEAAVKLNKVQRQLQENHLKGIPDSDISLEEIEQKKKLIQQAQEKLKAVRQKKIVRL
jgi:bla regulator protein blaR1